jgi:hypothetical protein
MKSRFYSKEDYLSYYKSLYDENPAKLDAEKALKEIINISKENNILLLIINIPELYLLREDAFPYVDQFLVNVTQNESNVIYLNLLPMFQNESAETLWVSFEDLHPNERAHRIIADTIYNSNISFLKK